MILAKGRDGRIGRMVRSMGMEAVVDPALHACHTRSVIVSENSILEDDQRAQDAEIRQRAKLESKRLQRTAARIAREKEFRDGRAFTEKRRHEAQLAKDRENMKWSKHFARVNGMSEDEKVAKSVVSDFSIYEMVQDKRPLRPINRRADFDIMQLTGNPMLRNETIFQPARDWERFVKGDELNNDRITDVGAVVGGTMLGRYEGQDVNLSQKTRRRISKAKGMGDEPGFWDQLWSQTQAEILKQAPQAIIQAEIAKQQQYIQPSPVPVALPSQIPAATLPAANPVARAAQTMGVPTWALVSVVGLMGVGVALVGYKMLAKKGQ